MNHKALVLEAWNKIEDPHFEDASRRAQAWNETHKVLLDRLKQAQKALDDHTRAMVPRPNVRHCITAIPGMVHEGGDTYWYRGVRFVVTSYRSSRIHLMPRKVGAAHRVYDMMSRDGRVSSSILSEIKAVVKGGRVWHSYNDCAYQQITRVKFGAYEVDLKTLDAEIVIDTSTLAYALHGFGGADFPPVDWYKPFLVDGSEGPG